MKNLDLGLLRELAMPANFKLGQEIEKTGEIDIVEQSTVGVKAKIKPLDGQRRTTEISASKNGLKWKCSCTNRETFCKHCVALGLRVLS